MITMILRIERIKVHLKNHMNQSSDNVLAKLEGCDKKSGGGTGI